MKFQNGSALVELALTITVLLLLVFGIIDFGRVFHAYLTLDHSSREAVRLASVGANDADVEAKAKSAAGSLDTNKLGFSISPGGQSSRTRGSYVSVELTYPVDFLTPFISQYVSSFTLTDTAEMRVE